MSATARNNFLDLHSTLSIKGHIDALCQNRFISILKIKVCLKKYFAQIAPRGSQFLSFKVYHFSERAWFVGKQK